MLSVVIPAHNSERPLVRTLSALVGASVAGVVRDVVIADAGSTDETAQVADMAGCALLVSTDPLAARLRAAAAAARSAWLLFLPPGSVPEAGWDAAAARHIEEAEQSDLDQARAAMFSRGVRPAGRSFFAEFAMLMRAALGERPDPRLGLLISRPLYDALGRHRDGVADPEADLIARLGRRRIARLSATVAVPP